MVTRLTTQDASFYFLEASSTPMHVGSLAIFRKPRNGLSYEELLSLVEERLSLVPRYRNQQIYFAKTPYDVLFRNQADKDKRLRRLLGQARLPRNRTISGGYTFCPEN